MAHTTFRKIAITTVGLALSTAGVLGVLLIEGRFARAEAPQQAPAEPPAPAFPAEKAKAPAEPPPSPSVLDEIKKGTKRAARKLRPARGY